MNATWAPGSDDMHDRSAKKRLQEIRDHTPLVVINYMSDDAFALDRQSFATRLRGAHRERLFVFG